MDLTFSYHSSSREILRKKKGTLEYVGKLGMPEAISAICDELWNDSVHGKQDHLALALTERVLLSCSLSSSEVTQMNSL